MNNIRRLDQSLLLTQLINYGVQKINVGNAIYYQECLDLYKLGLEYELVLEKGQINEAVYGNIALLGCHAKDFVWTDVFIEQYAPYLVGNRKEDARALSRGLWYFHQDRFEEAYELFMKHSFSHFYQPKIRLQIIKSLFELYHKDDSLFDLLNAQINTFETFLRRSDAVAEAAKLPYFNFLKICKQVIKITFYHPKKQAFKSKLLKSIKTERKLVSKKWLVLKIEKL